MKTYQLTLMYCIGLLVVIGWALRAQSLDRQPAEWANKETAERVESILGMQVNGINQSGSDAERSSARGPRDAGSREDRPSTASRFESRLGMVMVGLAGLIASAAVISVFLQRKQARSEPSRRKGFDLSESLREARQHLEAGELTASLRSAHKAAGLSIALDGDLHYANTTDGILLAEVKTTLPKAGFGRISALFGRVIYGKQAPDPEAIHEAIGLADALNSELKPDSPEPEECSS